MEDKDKKILQTLEAIKHPENFSQEELDVLLSDKECVEICQDLLDSREAFARLHSIAPDVEAEWESFKSKRLSSQVLSHSKRSTHILQLGAALLIAASIALFFLLHPFETSSYTVFEASHTAQVISIEKEKGINTIHIPRGMTKQLTLSDGTRIWLNAESSLKYPDTFEGKAQREVYLEGEAYFEVSKNPQHPFLVKTTAIETQVLGTSFNIKAYSKKDVQVTLLEGSIKVSDKHHNNILLKPGEHTNEKLHKSQVENVSQYRAWTTGSFYFDNTELIEIMRELGRWYNIDIVFTNKPIMTERLHFQADRSCSLQEVLELLNSMQKIKAQIENDKVIVGI